MASKRKSPKPAARPAARTSSSSSPHSRSSSRKKSSSQRPSRRQPQPKQEPLLPRAGYEVLAEGVPPRPVRNKRTASTSDDDKRIAARTKSSNNNNGNSRRKSRNRNSRNNRNNNSTTTNQTEPRPPRTGPKTPEGKARSSRNATTHGITVDYRHFQVLPWEDQSHFDELHDNLRAELKPEDTCTSQIVLEIAISQWLLCRVNCEERAALSHPRHRSRTPHGSPTDWIDIATKFERYRASLHRRLRRDILLASHLERQSTPHSRSTAQQRAHQKKLANLPRTRNGDPTVEAMAQLRAQNPKYGPDGKPYEVSRSYKIFKLTNCPSPHDYIVNYAQERINMSDGKDWIARFIPLTELMDGEFMKPKYGLGENLTKEYFEYVKTHEVYHPGTPYKTLKWPPPVPPGTPKSEEIMDLEMQIHPRPLELIAQREEAARKKKEAEQQAEAEAEAKAEAEMKQREEEGGNEDKPRRDNNNGGDSSSPSGEEQEKD